MKVLMISTDSKILEEGSAVRARMVEYSNLFDELHIILYTIKSRVGNAKIQITERTFVYPTNSTSKISRIFDAVRIGSVILNEIKVRGGDAVITAQDPFLTGLAGVFLKRRFKLKLNIQIHTDFLSPYFYKASLINKLFIFISKFILPKADSVRVVSSKIKESIMAEKKLNIAESKISILPIFVDIDAIRGAKVFVDLHKKYAQFQKIILMASRLTFEKDITTAIRAFSSILFSQPKTGLVIVGSGPELSRLKDFASNLGLKEKVVFEPWVPYDTLISYMKTSDLFLLSSLYEGYGMSLVEAVICGIPAVSTDVGIAKDLSLPVSRPGDDSMLAENILKGLKSVSSAQLSWSITKEEYLKKYSDILSA